jgi:hypothetical protein
MLSENEPNDKFTYTDIDNLSNYNYTFSLKDRFIHVKDNNGGYFGCQTPFLKILKPIHSTLNRKKEIAKKYLILETNDELDFENQIGDFMFIINKIHEISQEKIKENSLTWFNTVFDDIGLDIKVRRPIDQQKTNEFIKICIPNYIEEELSTLSKGTYILCNIIFKGLRISNDHIYEEWELIEFITQEKYDEEQNTEFITNNMETDIIETLLENNDYEHENVIVNNESINSTINQEINTEVNQEINTEVNQEISSEINKELNNNYNIENKVEIVEQHLDTKEKTRENNEIKEIKLKKNIKKDVKNNNKKKELIKKLSKKIIFN